MNQNEQHKTGFSLVVSADLTNHTLGSDKSNTKPYVPNYQKQAHLDAMAQDFMDGDGGFGWCDYQQ